MKCNLSETARALANATANDEDRPILTGVYINKKENVIVAANGYVLVVKTLQVPEMNLDGEANDGINEVVIPADAIKACKGKTVNLQTIESIKEIPSTELLAKNATVSRTKVVARLDGEDFSVEADSIDGKYPDYKPLVKPPEPFVGQVAVSTTVLKKLLRALPDDAILRLRLSEPEKPIAFQCSDDDGEIPIKGVIMPMSCDWKQVKW